ncbi:cytochrome P450 family protein [Actinoplanes derwentensis]|uniref:Cytochrome P450 n=1 Tax=Actinoplanes derwentensis TaxID=113562 RepID=A0A1H2DEA7_9ACTN|nr:cytochrome P450 [Actinoplanes derwentensis]GID84789.1 cytochrome P450 hydroxylase [Actinoplanes derwentensis]SDT81088.1 Cytochrome P450 [Actinoplanes derwentensis]
MQLPVSEEFFRDPYPVWAGLRDSAPASRVDLPDGSPVWLVTRYSDVRALLGDPRLSVDKSNGDGSWRGFSLPPALDANLLNMDPPNHTRIRRLVSQAFTPRRVENLRPLIQRTADDLLDALPGDGEADLIRGYAGPLPVAVICELLGVPETDRADFRSWTDVMLVPPRDDPRAGLRAVAAIHAYLVDLLARKRAEPADDLLSALIAARENGDRLSEDELTSLAFLLLLAGFENTVHAIGTGVLTLLTVPDRSGMVADIGKTVEELLRYEPPATVLLRRFTTEDVEVDGVVVPRAETVLLVVGAANRDPAVFTDPGTVLPGRSGGHLTFGHGIHYCVAAPLARIELEIAIGTLLRRFPELRLAVPAGELRWRPSFRARGLVDLPVRLT